jgi:hypothetical protein
VECNAVRVGGIMDREWPYGVWRSECSGMMEQEWSVAWGGGGGAGVEHI